MLASPHFNRKKMGVVVPTCPSSDGGKLKIKNHVSGWLGHKVRPISKITRTGLVEWLK
jgi:hypothetical protein